MHMSIYAHAFMCVYVHEYIRVCMWGSLGFVCVYANGNEKQRNIIKGLSISTHALMCIYINGLTII